MLHNLIRVLLSIAFFLTPCLAHADTPPSAPLQLAKFDGEGKQQCLQSARDPAAASHRLVQAQCTPVGGLQMFRFEPVAGGGYIIRIAETGGCLDVEWGASWAGGRVLDWSCNGQDNQRWEVNYPGSHPSIAKIRSWSTKLCLDFQDRIAVQVACGNWEDLFDGPIWYANRQHLRLPSGEVWGYLQQNGLCMTTDQHPVMRACNTQSSWLDLRFNAIDNASMTFELWSTRPDFCLVDTYGGFAVYMQCPGNGASTWRLVQRMPDHGVPLGASANRWQFQNVATGLCLDGSTTGLVQTTPCAGTPNVTWSFLTP